MCGIAGIHLKDPGFVKQHAGLENFSNALLLGIESRGRRATGFVATKERGLGTVIEKADMSASDFIQVRKELPVGARTVLLHTRLDTQGTPKNNDNNHPVVCKSTFTTHNGVIYNDDELFESYNLDRKAQVDSEIISALLNKTGLNKAEDALGCFQGSLAIAAIDPIKSPDQLLLAKGEFSPLVVLENDDFIVWASERKAIEEAWALVLGTPPKFKRFHYFKEGEFWLVNNDQTVLKSEFSVLNGWEERRRRREERKETTRNPTDGIRVTRETGWSREHGWGHDDDYGYHSSRVSGPVRAGTTADKPTTRTDLKELVVKLRADGLGKAHIQGKCTAAEVHAAARGIVTWVKCFGCNEFVLRDELHASLSWGKMCVDCYHVAINLSKFKADPKNWLDGDDKRRINNWVKIEAHIHRKALAEIATEVELDPDTIEWLVFRCPATFTTKHKEANDLAAELDDRYQVTTARLFEEHGIRDSTSVADTVNRGVSQEVDAPKDPFVNCAKHYCVFRSSEGCSKCTKEFGTQESPFLSKINDDRTVCRVCKTNGRIQRGKVRLGALIFCKKHWKECGTNDGLNAVATAEDGTRLCHFCARSKKGLLFDGGIKDFGAELVRIP